MSSVVDSGTQVGESVEGSAAEKGGRVQLGIDRVDLGRSDISVGSVEFQVDPHGRFRHVKTIAGHHDGAGLSGGGSDLSTLGREDVLANTLCLGKVVSLILGGDVERRILGERGENLDQLLALQWHRLALLGSGAEGSCSDGIFDADHLRSLVVEFPVSH